MKKTIWNYGLISGGINAAWMFTFAILSKGKIHFGMQQMLGYASMLLAFSLVFFGIKICRNQYLGGVISFGNAFKVGILITLISSSIYVAAWLIDYYFLIPDFADQYAQYIIDRMKSNGESEQLIQRSIKDMESFKEMYRNPFYNVMMTFSEVFPIGLIVTLICAALLKRKIDA